MLALTAVGLLVVAVSDWRRGVGFLGVGLLVSALARLALDDYGAGMLRVRRKWFDVALLVLTGAALIALAVGIPNQPGQ